MIAALLDNYMYQNQDNGFALKEVLWNRVLDVNDRGLRYIITGLGGKSNGITRESSFDITPASEIMAILCLAKMKTTCVAVLRIFCWASQSTTSRLL